MGRRRRLRNWLAALGLALSALALPLTARAADKAAQRPLGFSNLVLRVEHSTGIVIAPDAYRVMLLEHLRELGFNAVGAESVVFGRDEAQRAERVLGGTVRRLECEEHETTNCRISIRWEVLDVASGAVAYEATTSFALYGVDLRRSEATGRQLVLGALNRVAARAKFRATLSTEQKVQPSTSGYEPASFEPCGAAPSPLPAGADTAMDGTVVVEAGDGYGSGFFLNRDGLILTAAHVVAEGSALTIRQHDGVTFAAVVVRQSRKSDIALLRPLARRASKCLPSEDSQKLIGADAYVIGSPASKDFAFSVSRGIVSGARVVDGSEYWQTDASINPGNSGGPMLTSAGRVFAVTSWKVTGGMEGIGFGVPLGPGLKALGLKTGTLTDESLWQSAPESTPAPTPVTRTLDAADPIPTLDPEAEKRRLARVAAEKRQEEERQRLLERAERERELEERRRADEAQLDAMTPGYVRALKWGGAGLAAVGVLGAVITTLQYEEGTTTKPNYDGLRLANDLCWVGAGLGVASVLVGFKLAPSRDDLKRAPVKQAELAFSARGLVLRGAY